MTPDRRPPRDRRPGPAAALLRRLVVARDRLLEAGVLHLGSARTATAALDVVLAA